MFFSLWSVHEDLDWGNSASSYIEKWNEIRYGATSILYETLELWAYQESDVKKPTEVFWSSYLLEIGSDN